MIFNNGDQREYSSIDIIDPPLDTNNLNNYLKGIGVFIEHSELPGCIKGKY